MLALLGPDHRFHTRVYQTGDLDSSGTLNGDIVLVAAGDPNLSNRIRPDGTLAFEDVDHSYGGPNVKPVAGHPLTVIDALAAQIAARGIKRVTGRVRVDSTLFPEGDREGGTGVVISPIVVYDNVIDLIVTAGASAGSAAEITTSPQTSYVRFVNRLTTGPSGTTPDVNFEDVEESDASHTVTVTGVLPAGGSRLTSFAVPSPTRFAEVVLSEALQSHGVVASVAPKGEAFDAKRASASYVADKLVAEHVSLPAAEAARVILKVSQNLHASMMPSVLGATAPAGEGSESPLQRGFDRMKTWLDGTGVELSGASQGDGAGASADYTPHFMASYLAWWTKQPAYDAFRRALPVMGKDGTLVEILKNSPAAGHVFAKTGTYGRQDRLQRRMFIDGKGLAGYIDTAGGRRLAFAAYLNFATIRPDQISQVGNALGEIGTALYSAF